LELKRIGDRRLDACLATLPRRRIPLRLDVDIFT